MAFLQYSTDRYLLIRQSIMKFPEPRRARNCIVRRRPLVKRAEAALMVLLLMAPVTDGRAA